MAKNGGTTSSKTPKNTTSRATARWVLTGVSKRTRETVARAAQKDEMPIGRWVDRILREAAETRLKGGPPGLALPPELLDTLAELSQRVRELSESRSFGNQAFQRVQTTASEFGEQISSTYDTVVKRADSAIAEVRSWTDERFSEAAKWSAGVIEQLKSAAGGIEHLQALITNQEKAEEKAPPPPAKNKRDRKPASAGKAGTTRRAPSRPSPPKSGTGAG